MPLTPEEAPRVFPELPRHPSWEEQIRMALLHDLNIWANNDRQIARDKAKILIDVIARQFDLSTISQLHEETRAVINIPKPLNIDEDDF